MRRIFPLLSYNRMEFCPSMQHHLSLFSLSSGYHIRLSISTHPPLRRQALLKGFFLAREQITVQVEDHSYSNFWASVFPVTEEEKKH